MANVQIFKTLYQFCEIGEVELRALPSRKRIFIDLENLDAINQFCETNKSENLFFGVALRKDKDGTKNGITQIPAVYCDCDFKESPRELIAEKLKSFPFKPSLTIKSGHGVHFYFILKEPAESNEIDQIEDVNRRIASYLGGDFAACDASRILRIPGTINHKYNPPVLCEVVQENSFTYSIEDFLDTLPNPISSKTSSKTESKSEDKAWLSEAMAGCEQGNRNSTATKIAGYWINKVSPQDTLLILQSWNTKNSPPLSEKELQIIINSVSRYEPEKKKPRVDISNVYSAKDMLREYREYIKNLKQNKFVTGINEIDQKIRGVAGGEVLTIIARAGSFKTALLQNMLKNYTQNTNWGAVFFSLEMPIPSVTERYLQILDGCSGMEVEQLYLRNNTELIKESEKQFCDDLKRLFVVPTKVNLGDMAQYVNLIQKEKNTKIGVVGIDYMGLIDSKGINEYEIISKVARGAKDLAKMLNIPVVVLSQVSRKGGDGENEISLDMGRGSGAIEEGADFILGLWQHNIGLPENPDYSLICRILKNRKGPKGSYWELDLAPYCLTIGETAKKFKPPAQKRTKSI